MQSFLDHLCYHDNDTLFPDLDVRNALIVVGRGLGRGDHKHAGHLSHRDMSGEFRWLNPSINICVSGD